MDLIFEITNTGDKDLDANVDLNYRMEVKGPGVVDRFRHSMNCMPPEPTRIKAGETIKMPIRGLAFSTGKQSHTLYWTKPGDYEVSVSYDVSALPAPAARGADGPGIKLTGGPVKLKVIEGKEGAPFLPPQRKEPDRPKPALEAPPAK